MPFYPPQISHDVSRWKDEANALPEPEGGGHILDAILRMVAPQLRRGIGRWAEGTYEDQPWQTVAADTLIPDSPWEEATSIAGMPNAAGMVRMGGKNFENALLHRGLSDPAELDWWSKIFKRGISSQKPTSLVTPSVLQTFGSEPYGLLFNAPQQGSIRAMGPKDLNTQMTEVAKGLKQKWEVPGWMEDETLSPLIHGVDSLLSKQRDLVAEGVKMGSPNAKYLIHNEIIPNIDRSMLAGVRLPMSELDMLEMGPTISSPMQRTGTSDIYKALTQFAEQQHVPIFRWPAEMTQAQQLKGLEAPLKGTWKTPPGKNYITSDMLEKIFGITELP